MPHCPMSLNIPVTGLSIESSCRMHFRQALGQHAEHGPRRGKKARRESGGGLRNPPVPLRGSSGCGENTQTRKAKVSLFCHTNS